MMLKPTIGVVTTSFPRNQADFAGRFVFELSRKFQQHGYQIEVVVPEPNEETDWSPNANWLDGMTVHPAAYFRPKRYQTLFFGAGVPDNLRQKPTRLGLVPPALTTLAAQIHQRSRGWSGMISHWLVPSACVSGMAVRKTVPHLAIAHSGDVHLLSSNWLRPILNHAPQWATHFGFISETLRQRFVSLLSPDAYDDIKERTHITPMGIDLQPVLSSERPSSSPFTVLFLGRLVPIKGVSLLVNAVSRLKNTRLIVAGDGPVKKKLESEAAQHGIDASFIGPVAPDDRAALFAGADALVLPSRTSLSGRTEGLPLTLLEAMGASLPVVASDTGSMSELISHDQNGLLFPDGEVFALTQCLKRLMENVSLRNRLAESGYQTARNRSWTALFPRFEKLVVPNQAR